MEARKLVIFLRALVLATVLLCFPNHRSVMFDQTLWGIELSELFLRLSPWIFTFFIEDSSIARVRALYLIQRTSFRALTCYLPLIHFVRST